MKEGVGTSVGGNQIELQTDFSFRSYATTVPGQLHRDIYKSSTMGVHVSTLPDDAPESVFRLEFQLFIARCVTLSALSIAAYDWFACLDEEVDLICKFNTPSLVQTTFLLTLHNLWKKGALVTLSSST
jgi:hypothetical protein